MDIWRAFRVLLNFFFLTLLASGCAESPPTASEPVVLIHQVRNGSEWVNVAAPTTLLANRETQDGLAPVMQAAAAEIVMLRETSASAPPPAASAVFGASPRYEPVPDLRDREKWRVLTEPANPRREPPAPVPVAAPAVSAPPAPAPTAPNRGDVAASIIARSLGSYSGNCPCPYHVDSAGRSCGGRSAYSRPGGEAPICYPDDVTDAMIAAFR